MEHRIKSKTVTVIGDIILDKYILSNVSRISPEAPIPIAEVLNENCILGGAANVALNLRRLGAKVNLVGSLGHDDNGRVVSELLSNNKINIYPIISDKPTTTKVRVVANKHQMIRLDYEDITQTDPAKVKETLERMIDPEDILIVSDYGKGFISESILKYLAKLGNYKCIDTKSSQSNLTGFDFIKPNFSEAVQLARMLGSITDYKNTDEWVEELGRYLRNKLKTDILLTRGEKGAIYVSENDIDYGHINNTDVIDVTGAGDTSISTFALLRSCGYDVPKSLEIMNKAAEITVRHLGTYAPRLEEIIR